jgi:hypothetical protein
MNLALSSTTRRLRFNRRFIALTLFLFLRFSSAIARAQTAIPATGACALQQDLVPSQDGASAYVTSLVAQIRQASYPHLASIDLRVRTFRGDGDYFQTRFSFSHFFLFQRMRYFVEVNPDLFARQVPAQGVCAILAHELAHVVTLSHGNRIRRFSLVRLLSRRFTRQFERRTDLEAIHLGYGDGLKTYRAWVYAHIPPVSLAEKRKRYFSPEEISSLQQGLNRNPELLAYWRKHTPLSAAEILSSPGYPH